MNLEDLHLALTVAESGGFAAAARRVGLDPSSVSRIIAGLEAELGIRLFQRSTRRLALTEEGRAYLDRTAPLLEELEQAREAALQGRSTQSGWLRLTTSVAFGSDWIVPRLPAFRRAYPDIALDLVLTDGNLDLVSEGIDLALRLAPAPTGDLISTRLTETRYRVVASPDWVLGHGAPLTPEALSDLACIRQSLPGYRDRWRFRPSTPADKDQDAEPVIDVPVGGTVLISSPLAIRQAARAGLGPALLADWLVGDDLAAGRLVDLFPHHQATATTFDTGIWALYPSRAFLPAKVRVAIDFLRVSLNVVEPPKK